MEPEVESLLSLLMEDTRLAQFSIGDLIEATCELAEDDLRQYTMATEGEPPHPLVVECLGACINHLRDASMAYYASTK